MALKMLAPRNKNRVRYLSFRRKTLNKYIDADWYFWYQCVDLIRYYCWEVFNYNMGQLSSAKDANIKTTFPWFQLVKVGTEDLRSWDIITFWATKNNKHGHIAIVDNYNQDGVFIAEQNWVWGANKKTKDWSYPKLPWNQVRLRFVPRGNILNVFRRVIY